MTSWIVRTMRTCLLDDRQKIDDTRKTAAIKRELNRLNSDIVALQETRLPDSGSLKEERYTFFWQRRGVDEYREHGVRLVVRNTLVRMIIPLASSTYSIRLPTYKDFVTFYAPTLQATPEIKNQFYAQLDSIANRILLCEHIYLLGDFNAKVGADQMYWSHVLDHHSVEKMNENVQRLLEFCCVTNTYFQKKACHKASWVHLRSNHCHQLELVLTRHDCLKTFAAPELTTAQTATLTISASPQR